MDSFAFPAAVPAHRSCTQTLTRFVGCEAYRVESLGNDLARFTFLLGGSDGEGLFHRALPTSEHAGIPALKAATAVSSPRRTFSLAELTADVSVRLLSPGTGLRPGMGPARRAGLPGATLAGALDRTLACDYGLDIVEIPRYLGSHDRTHNGETIRTFAFTATCADPLQICQHAQVAHYWADFASLPDQTSQDLARLADLALQAAAGCTGDPPRQWQITTALRACSKGMYCEEAATELIINHRSWLLRDDFTKQFILTCAGSAGGITAVIDWEEALTALRAGTLPCSAAKPPSSTWPPASPLPHPSSCATPSPDSTRRAVLDAAAVTRS